MLAAQRDRLASLARLRSVELAVVPADAVVLVPWHNFVVWDTADGGRYVPTELIHGAQEVTAAESVDFYVEVWERLWAEAAHGSEAVKLIQGLIGETRRRFGPKASRGTHVRQPVPPERRPLCGRNVARNVSAPS